MYPWVIFDADNTLWETERLYDEARRKLASQLARRGIDEATATEVQQAIDEELYKTHGYSAQRFPESFDRTLTYFFPDATDLERDTIRSIAERVFRDPAAVHDSVTEVVEQLRRHYRLGILTAGENWVQQSRLSQFAHLHHFQAVEVVDQKNAATFESFIEKHEVDRKNSWVVGDSLKSDILPAHEVGLNAVLIVTRNWDRVEMSELRLPLNVESVRDLSEVLKIIPLPN
ncbi:HAD family hydrolase [Bradyrhizobium sp. RD5-C2]|uniref:HAD family hydrolase n=1 Tax=Bradyrhizobium sp. RD5-C2 TaxID=244562 RepID=UPI001CC5D5EA|nr:HAD family hydrolase [Bradyrhizobium sp. RD5-C2]GIQ75960.1 haloacid dehalogenase [Bradyrhizobium sp. RD5-C2]